ncbi:preQ(1) synthase [Fibrobacterota bacterium]
MAGKKKQADTYKGLQGHIRKLKVPLIDTWEFQYPGSETEIVITIPEFTCLCPKTGLPDFAVLTVTYAPGSACLELKSLKEYILFYREVGIFHEHVVNKVMEDCVRSCSPRRLEVRGTFNARGGIQTTAVASYKE